MTTLFRPIEQALVRLQGLLSRASINQQDHVERLAQKTGSIYDKTYYNALLGGLGKGLFQVVGAGCAIYAAKTKLEGYQTLPPINKDSTPGEVKIFERELAKINAIAEKMSGWGRLSEAAAGGIDSISNAHRAGCDKDRELTQTQMSQQAATRSSMTNIEQYSNTLEQRVDSQKQSARQV